MAPGSDYDVTGDPTIEGETKSAVGGLVTKRIGGARIDAETTMCTDLFSVESINRPLGIFTHTGFASSIWLIRSATAALRDRATGTVFCICGKPKFAITFNYFNIYFYDYFQDAVDSPHILPDSQEFVGSTAFLSRGAWGILSTSIGVNA